MAATWRSAAVIASFHACAPRLHHPPPPSLLYPHTHAHTHTHTRMQVSADNERYGALLTTVARSGAEVYPSRGVGTLAVSVKAKEVTAAPPTAER